MKNMTQEKLCEAPESKRDLTVSWERHF